MLQRGGYEIKILNTVNFRESMRYNPFRYIRCENDILKLVNCIMENTKGEGSRISGRKRKPFITRLLLPTSGTRHRKTRKT